MANPSLLEQFCSDGQKDAVSTILQTAGWSPENPNINGYQLNTILNEIYTYLNYLKNKGLSFWEDTKPYKATAGDIDIVRYANKIYFAKLDSNIDGLTPKTPDTNPTYWGVLYDFSEPLHGLLRGYVLPFAVSTVPNGFLECNGAELSRITYADLYAVIGDTYGAGDGSTTFNIPDLRGEFIRGFDNGKGIDSGRAIGTAQGDAIRNITGGIGTRSDDQSLIDRVDGVFSGSETADRTNLPSGDSTSYFRYITFDASTVVPTANENRPRNIAMMYCIKY